MAQFDVYANANFETRGRVPYLLDIQHDLLDNLSTRVVIPLVVGMKPVTHLTPVFVVDGQQVSLSTAEMAGVPLRVLGAKVSSLEQSRQEIIAAVDFLITGF
jgi:toxin CcdB